MERQEEMIKKKKFLMSDQTTPEAYKIIKMSQSHTHKHTHAHI